MRLAVALVCLYSTAHAGNASQLFDEAQSLKKAGKIDEACSRFASSWEQEKAIGTQLNLADCKEREGRLLEAWQMFWIWPLAFAVIVTALFIAGFNDRGTRASKAAVAAH